MSSTHFKAGTGIERIIEQQMRNWELARAQRPVATRPTEKEVGPFITVSRTVGSGGAEVAARVGSRLGWPVFDREILQLMAADHASRALLYQQLDERDATWVEQTLRPLVLTEVREDYFHRLGQTVLALGRKGRVVLLGRGADLFLPRDHGLRVHVAAPLKMRVQRFALRTNIPEAVAAPEVERIDRERADFRLHHFGPTANEATRFDLSLTLDTLDVGDAVELTLLAARRRGLIDA